MKSCHLYDTYSLGRAGVNTRLIAFFEDRTLEEKFTVLRRGAGSIVVFGVISYEGNLPESGGIVGFGIKLRKGIDPQPWAWIPIGLPAYEYYRRKSRGTTPARRSHSYARRHL
jgi:hypothetical protein